MKKRILHLFLALFMVLSLSTNALAQHSRPSNNPHSRPSDNPPPLPPGHGNDEDQSGPIGGGLALLLSLGAAYGAKKVYDARKKLNG